MMEGSGGANLVESLGGEGVLIRSPQQQDRFDKNADRDEGGRSDRGAGVGCGTEIRNRLPTLPAMHVPSQPIRSNHSNAMLGVSDLVDRLSHVQVSKSSHSTSLSRQSTSGNDAGGCKGLRQHGSGLPPSQASIQLKRVGTVPATQLEKPASALLDHGDNDNENDIGAADCDEVVEHTETTHDETLSVVAENGRGESHGRRDNDESLLEDVSVMTGSFGNNEDAIQFRQQWQSPKRHRRDLKHTEGGEDDDASGGASGFSLDAMVGHSSCESSVTWYEGSHIDEITVDDEADNAKSERCDESHEDVLLECASSGDETGGSDVEVVVYEDDETIFEWTSTESFFGEDDVGDPDVTRASISLEQSLSSASASASASSCTSPLSSPPPQPQLVVSPRLERDD
jgi:hypothetical protein